MTTVDLDNATPEERLLYSRLFCAPCLAGEHSWGEHSLLPLKLGPTMPGPIPSGTATALTEHISPAQPQPQTHLSPPTRKVLSFDQAAAVAGLEAGTHGRQCIACGNVLEGQ